MGSRKESKVYAFEFSPIWILDTRLIWKGTVECSAEINTKLVKSKNWEKVSERFIMSLKIYDGATGEFVGEKDAVIGLCGM